MANRKKRKRGLSTIVKMITRKVTVWKGPTGRAKIARAETLLQVRKAKCLISEIPIWMCSVVMIMTTRCGRRGREV